jgi:hypothetical protein
MTFGHNRAIDTESVYNAKDDRELPAAYTRFMTQSLGYAKRLDWVLQIGFGGGRTYLHRFLPNAPITSVELDPDVVGLGRGAQSHRGSQPQMAAVTGRAAAISIYGNAFVVGGVLMGFEMLGSRCLYRYCGGGIGTWAGLISTVARFVRP